MDLKSLLYTFFYSIKLFFSFTGLTFSLYFKRRRAKSLFRKELVALGLSHYVAEEIAEEFPLKTKEMLKLLRGTSGN